jgi:methyltransferase family protein
MSVVTTVPVESLHQVLGLSTPVRVPPAWRNVALVDWKMEADDAILRQVFRQVRPMRHLEFGTWLGDGVLRCVEECEATVWTINLLEGETKPSGEWAYGELERDQGSASIAWGERQETQNGTWIRTDAYGQVGRKYLEAGWGKRVCQIYADSREWDTRAYPTGFFDTCLIDGGHAADIVQNDTTIATRLVRAGGLVMWHDFCPDLDVRTTCDSTRDVVDYITRHATELERDFEKLLWVLPSWLLIGVRRHY